MAAACCLAAMFFGCSKSSGDENPAAAPLVGEWRLDAWNDELVTDFSIYLKLEASGRFELYQQLEHGYYERFDGRYNADGGVLTGVYSDGEPWQRYDYALESNGARLVLTAQGGDRIRSVYVKTSIPSDIVVVEPSAALTASSRRRIF